MTDQEKILSEVTDSDYKFGFHSDIETETIPKGLSEDVVRLISAKKEEPGWLTEARLKAFRHWQTMLMPKWAHLTIPEINYQDIIYYAAPKREAKYQNMDEVDPELLDTFNRLGIPLEEQKQLAGVAVDAVMDSISVKTTFQDTLADKGIIFCSFSEAVQNHPDLIKKYMGSVVPYTDNFFAVCIGDGNTGDFLIHAPTNSGSATVVRDKKTASTLVFRNAQTDNSLALFIENIQTIPIIC